MSVPEGHTVARTVYLFEILCAPKSVECAFLKLYVPQISWMKFNDIVTVMSMFKACVVTLEHARPSVCHSMFSLLLYKLAVWHYPQHLYVHISTFPLFYILFPFLNNACSRLTSNKEYRHTQTKSAWFTVTILFHYKDVCMPDMKVVDM